MENDTVNNGLIVDGLIEGVMEEDITDDITESSIEEQAKHTIKDSLTDGLVFHPDKTAGIIRELHAKTLLSILEIGRHLLVAKERLNHGEFGRWIEDRCGFSYSTARSYMQMTKIGYLHKNEIVNMKASAFRSIAKGKLPPDLFGEVMKTGMINDKEISNMSTKEIENEIEKLKSEIDKEIDRRMDAEKTLEISKNILEEKDKEISSLESKLDKLKSPDKQYELHFEQTQDIISEAIFNVQKASLKSPKPNDALSLLSSLIIATNRLGEEWGVKWDDKSFISRN